MKKLFLILFVCLIAIGAIAQAKPHRFYFVKPVKEKLILKEASIDTILISDVLDDVLDETFYIADSSFYFAPAVTFSAIKVNSVGVNPTAMAGLGYGLNWKPTNSKLKCESLVGLNTFFNIGLTFKDKTEFSGSLSEVVSLYDNILSVGGMYDFNKNAWYIILGTSIELKW